MSLFNHGEFSLHSGASSQWLIDCDALSDSDLETLALMATEMFPSGWSSVEGVPTGGLRFADALAEHSRPGGPLLIADDVLTSGASMEEFRDLRFALGVVIFARDVVTYPWIRAIWNVNRWLKDAPRTQETDPE